MCPENNRLSTPKQWEQARDLYAEIQRTIAPFLPKPIVQEPSSVREVWESSSPHVTEMTLVDEDIFS